MQNTSTKAAGASSLTTAAPEIKRQVAFGESVYNEAMHFLIEEAHLLDEGLFNDWLQLLTEEVVCTMPVRRTLNRDAGTGLSNSMVWLREDIHSLTFKAKRLVGDSAFNEDPPSRVRRLITNLRLHETTNADEYLAQSYLLLRRNRGDAHAIDTLSCRRDDILRRTARGWRLARRTILIDQAVLGMPNLAVFL